MRRCGGCGHELSGEGLVGERAAMRKKINLPAKRVTRVCPGVSGKYCGKHFEVCPDEAREGYSGLCEGCNRELAEKDRAESNFEIVDMTINPDLKICLFIPATVLDPDPWNTYAPLVERLNREPDEDFADATLVLEEIRAGDDPFNGITDANGVLVWWKPNHKENQ